MKLERLFHVLVVVGGASAAGACEADGDELRREPTPDAGVATIDADERGLDPCFCDVAACCDRSVAPAQVMTGFTCCWSTTCP